MTTLQKLIQKKHSLPELGEFSENVSGASRIHAYRRYNSDLVAAAVAGWLVAETFYSFNKDVDKRNTGDAGYAPTLLRISIPLWAAGGICWRRNNQLTRGG